ncbi:uncharacterized protein LOC131354242 isoform X2 [Hemibagrus wyckioides]|uniref:uncharacterized protein LOC131354242 isoform X2 n=1 Tax=Hemibagrus wyckioides TaxID=337641 RepID=UPI00266C9308|nr:uncharacterized protein LOC131354242 isoform X2 [Hemibagrus wyckioides]
MKSPLFLSLLLVLSGVAVGKVRYYHYIPIKMNWTDAQNYCRGTYTDLAAIATAEESQAVIEIAKTYQNNFWIGMNKILAYDSWGWCDGEQTNIFNWIPGVFPFLCHWNIILVKQNKTWEEALQYCMKNYLGLACPSSASKILFTETEAAQSQTVSVWTGLHFMNGRWFWLSWETTMISLPSCPVKNYRCGARNLKTHTWENRHCNEKLNFICYTR